MFDVFVSKTTGGTINVVFFLDVPRFLGALNGFFSDFNRGLQKLPDVAPWQSEKYIYICGVKNHFMGWPLAKY